MRYNILSTLGLIIWLSVNTNAQCKLDKSLWTCVFNEEFAGPLNELDQNWYFDYGVEGDGMGGWTSRRSNRHDKIATDPDYFFIPINEVNPIDGIGDLLEIKSDQEALDQSALYLSVIKLQDGQPIPWKGVNYRYQHGVIRSKFNPIYNCPDPAGSDPDPNPGGFAYGMIEMRAKLPSVEGQYSTLFITGSDAHPPEANGMEFNAHSPYRFFSPVYFECEDPMDCDGGFQSHKNYFYFPYDITDDWHIWTVVWTPTSITWFFDGRELKTDMVSHHIPGYDKTSWNFCAHRKMEIILRANLSFPDEQEENFEPLKIDYVKIYQPASVPAYSGNFEDHYNVLLDKYAITPFKSTIDWVVDGVKTSFTNGSTAGDPSEYQYDATNNHDYLVEKGFNIAQEGNKYIYIGEDGRIYNTYWANFNPAIGSRYYTGVLNEELGPVNAQTLAVANNGAIVYYIEGNRLYYLEYFQGGYGLHFIPESIENNAKDGSIIAHPNGLEIIYRNTNNRPLL